MTDQDRCPASFGHAYDESQVCVFCKQPRPTKPPALEEATQPTEPYAPPSAYAGYVPTNTNPGPLEPVLDVDPEQPMPPPVDSIEPGTITIGTVGTDGLARDGFITIESFDTRDVEPREPVEKILSRAFKWYVSGGSPMGWSKLKTAKLCLRSFYYAHVLRLRTKFDPTPRLDEESKERVNALDLGTLTHTCVEAFYRTADPNKAMEPALAVKDQYPTLAMEAMRLTSFYLRKFNSFEAARWDLRAVERESRFYYPARKCCGKRRRLLISARHDHVYRLREPGQKHLPPGEPGDNVRLHELKTTATLTGSRLRGFHQNAQLMTGLLSYNFGHAVDRDGNVLLPSNAELIGPTDLVTVTWIGKAKRADLNRDIDRVDYAIPFERVQRFAEEIEDWYYEEIGERIFRDEFWLDPETWRKDWTCADIFWQGWTCPYVSLCEASGPVNYDLGFERPAAPFDRDVLEMPKKLEKQSAKGEAAAKVEAK